MRGSGAFRAVIAPGGALAGPWVRNDLWRRARAVPSLDLRLAERKSLVDATTGQNLVTFTRASSGTFVDSQGVIRTATTNLKSYSDAILVGNGFGVNNATLAAAANITPTGASSASLFTLNVGANTGNSSDGFNYGFNVNLANSTQHTQSLFVKPAGSTILRIRSNVSGLVADFTLTGSGTTPSLGAELQAASITPLSSGWYRVSWTYTTTTSIPGNRSDYWAIKTNVADGVNGIYVAGAQLEQSSTVGEYIPTGATINSAPRFDHNPTTGESLGLLVEESRTNSIRNNTMVGAVAGTPGTLPTNWGLSGGGLGTLTQQVVGTGVSNGVTYVDIRFSGTTSTTGLELRLETVNGIAASNGQTWTFSTYMAVVGGSLSNISTIGVNANLSDASTAFLSSFAFNVPLNTTSSLSRSIGTATIATANTAFIRPLIFLAFSSGVAIDITLRIGLPQLEQGAFASSVIPTYGTAATRSADVASISGSNFSSWYRQDEGTVFADASVLGRTNSSPIVQFQDATAGDRIQIRQNSTATDLLCQVIDGGSASSGFASTAFTPNVFYKTALAIKAADHAATINAGSVSTSSVPSTMPTVDRIVFNTTSPVTSGSSLLKRITYWPQRLSNSTLQSITT